MGFIYNQIHSAIFMEGYDIYAILDAASIPHLLKKIYSKLHKFKCLYPGDQSFALSDVAPYIVPLELNSDFTKWLINEGWGNHWGIYVAVEKGQSNLKTMTEHFRKFMVIQNPENKSVYFRFYDPRVLRDYLPVFDPDQCDTMYGSIIAYYAVEDENSNILHFKYGNQGLKVEKIELIKREIGANAVSF